MSQCVRKGDRPAESLIPDDTPAEIIQMMKRCWDHCPQKRPTFKGLQFVRVRVFVYVKKGQGQTETNRIFMCFIIVFRKGLTLLMFHLMSVAANTPHENKYSDTVVTLVAFNIPAVD